ncbi:hypothetical protein [Xanthocytophaga agilis]|uniref:Uncharacterized protein n=1 Tax=Xanthocytophaga agilis TaxID=3048010 RepID=A0AAE3R9T5_9BACT|nr:hypothetical protein [Xanthocytophaga agilis]MDJ1506286.1 hypothetical protein [Xanthocytophaga agilis]
MIRYWITILYFLEIVCCLAQNRTTEYGLKVGKWIEKEMNNEELEIHTGNYKIIQASAYIITDTLDSNIFGIAYPEHERIPYLSIEGKYENFISVKDGTWETHDSSGTVYNRMLWQDGLNIESASFNSDGDTTNYYYYDFQNDRHYSCYYREGECYLKEYDPYGERVRRYYPNRNLIIPEAEPEIDIMLLENNIGTYPLKLSSKSALKILSITSGSGIVEIIPHINSYPISISPNQEAEFTLKFIAEPENIIYALSDTLTIQTLDNDRMVSYDIYCTIFPVHIHGGNLESLETITLSRVKDKYLLLAPLGTETDAYLIYKGNRRRYHTFMGMETFIKIDIRDLSDGTYPLSISSCNDGKDIFLRIVK